MKNKKSRNLEVKGNPNFHKTNVATKSKESETKKSNKKATNYSSYDIFERCIKRATNLVNIETEKKEQTSDCYRASVVLTISALDAYIRSLLVDKIKTNVSHKGKPINVKLTEYIKKLIDHDEMLEAARNYDFMERIEKAVRGDFEKKSFQGETRIEHYMEYIGHKDFFEDVSKKTDKNKENIKGDLARYTKRRHVIAHCGDYELNQVPVKENEITKEYSVSCIKFVKMFAKTIKELTQ